MNKIIDYLFPEDTNFIEATFRVCLYTAIIVFIINGIYYLQQDNDEDKLGDNQKIIFHNHSENVEFEWDDVGVREFNNFIYNYNSEDIVKISGNYSILNASEKEHVLNTLDQWIDNEKISLSQAKENLK